MRNIKKHLQEAHGFADFENDAFFIKSKIIAKRVIYLKEEYQKHASQYTMFHYGTISDEGTYNMGESNFILDNFFINDGDLPWIHSLNLLVKYKNGRVFESAILSDAGVWEEEDGDLIFNKQNIIITDDLNNINTTMVIFKDCVEKATIEFVFGNNKMTLEELTFVVMHELGHIYDIFKSKLMSTFINRDLQLINPNFKIDAKHNNIIDKLVHNMLSITQKKNLILKDETFDEIAIYDCFQMFVYMLNSSELRQRLKNFHYDLCNIELSKIIITRTKLNSENTPKKRLETVLVENSEEYNFYFNVSQLFRLFVQYTPVETKKKFAEIYIKEVFAKKISSDNIYGWEDPFRDGKLVMVAKQRPYIRSFKDNGEYNENSFNKFFEFHIKRIDDIFLKNANLIAVDVNEIENHKKLIFECGRMRPELWYLLL